MKKMLLIMLLFLTACTNDGPVDDSSDENADQSEESTESATEEQQTTEEPEEEMSAADIIKNAQSEESKETSYEERQTTTISTEESQHVIRTITTRSKQDEIKIEVDDGTDIKTHYIFEGEHFIYQNGDVERQDDGRNIEGSSYGDLISQLEPFKEGTAKQLESGYEIRYEVEGEAGVKPFINDDLESSLEAVDNINGLVLLKFNEDYQYESAELTLTMEMDDQTINVSSNITMDKIGEINVIEKPKGM
ncbi:hypothetical protein GCM10022378_13000 [Salinicoccus jeotgali]|uniref:Lipoprotein n=1 Tax=Salinicoccus jeotgali TaxID=381634 RepID=A0ABP7EYM6_9STAP